jgi:hypothetical protein
MIEIDKVHLSTLKSMKNFQLDYRNFESIDALKSELERLRTIKRLLKLRYDMKRKYTENPEKYRQMRYENRDKQKKENPEEYKRKVKAYSEKSYLKKKMKKVEELKLLELPDLPKKEDVDCDVCKNTRISYWSDDIYGTCMECC